MRYLAKTDDGCPVGEGRTIKTAVDRARKRDGAYVVDDSTGAIQWRKPEAAKPSPLPWKQDDGLISDENGVEVVDLYDYPAAYLNAALIVRAVNAHAGLVDALKRLIEWDDAGCDASRGSWIKARAALRAAGEAV